MIATTAADADALVVSWRDRKKLKTRAELIAVSQRLFLDQGYAGTTLDDICDEVGVRPQTLLRYFDSKAHLALAPLYDQYEAFRSRMESPDRDLDAVALWRAQVEAESLRHNRHVGRFFRWVNAEPVLRAMNEELRTRYEDLLAAGIASDAHADPEDFYSVMLATTLIRGNAAMLRRWTSRNGKPQMLAANQLAVVDFVLEMYPSRESAALPGALPR
jgi:AcrR family transcriptional regulator